MSESHGVNQKSGNIKTIDIPCGGGAPRIPLNSNIAPVLLVLMLIFSQGAMSDGMRVSPLKLQFDADSHSALVKVSNGSQQKITVQLDALTWTQDQTGQDQYVPTSEIVFFPRIFNIEPGDQRVVRVGYQGKPVSTEEKAFRLYVQELPVQKPGEIEMQFAVRMGIPIFVSPKIQAPAWNVSGAELTEQGFLVRVDNSGSRYVKIGEVEITGRNAGGAALFTAKKQGWYVLAGRGRDFVVPLSEKHCGQVASLEFAVTSGNETRTKQLSAASIDCGANLETATYTNPPLPGK